MSNITAATIKELSDTFDSIHEILIRENENNWIKGINSIRERLSRISNDSALDDIHKEIGLSYRHMSCGAGSFADFMIWREDFDERQKLNEELESLINKAWKLLDL